MQRRVGTVSAVADVSFSLPRGQTFGMVGESGCGKTTIGRLIVGLEKPTGGAIRFGGEGLIHSNGRGYPPQRRGIPLMVPDGYAPPGPRPRGGTHPRGA